MGTSLLTSPPAIGGCRELSPPFLSSTKLFLPAACKSSVRRSNFRSSLVVKSYSDDEIPKQFRAEHLREGMMDNFKNIPSSLYGLTPSEMEMFLPEERPAFFKQGEIDEETLTSAHYYTKTAKLNMLDSYGGRRARTITQASRRRYMGGGRRGGRRRRRTPPDLPSYLLHKRIVYLGLPLYAPVTELIVAELLWLDSYRSDRDIYLYINSTGTQDEYGRLVGAETDAFCIADCMSRVNATIHTINCGTAYGQAAMLLSLGDKGRRNLMPGSLTKLYLPQMQQTVGDTTDMYIMAKELEAHTDITLEFLERGLERPRDVINKELQHGKFFMPREAIKFGIADRMLTVAPGKEYDMPEDLKEYLAETGGTKTGNLL